MFLAELLAQREAAAKGIRTSLCHVPGGIDYFLLIKPLTCEKK